VRDAQSDVLHSLYGVGTDITVTQAPKAGTGGPGRFGFGFGGTIPASFGGDGTRRGFITPKTFTLAGVDLSTEVIGPLAAGEITSGRTFAVRDSNGPLAVVDSDYAAQNKLKVGSTVAVGSSVGKPASFHGDRHRRHRGRGIGRLRPSRQGAVPRGPEEPGQHRVRGSRQLIGDLRRAARDQRADAIGDGDDGQLAGQRIEPGEQPGQVADTVVALQSVDLAISRRST
jgi:hypothetical protein